MRHTREKWGWVFYDWANSAFATTVMAGFFPVYFKAYWNTGLDPTESTFCLGLANSVASLLFALLAPVLGAMADCMCRRKAMLFVFACLGWVMTGGLCLVAEGDWMLAVMLYILAVIGFSGSNIFYDSLLLFICTSDELDCTSAFGFAFGCLGSGLLFACNILMVLHPGWFGLADGDAAVRMSFLMVAVWWLVFSLPLAPGVFAAARRDVRQTHPSAVEPLWEPCEAQCAERGGCRASGAYWLPRWRVDFGDLGVPKSFTR